MPNPFRLNQRFLFRNGIYVATMTPASRLAALAARLWPVETDFPLVRIGGPNDGGYLVPNDLDGIACCFSPGVGPTATFERHLFSGHGIPSHLADASVDAPPDRLRPASFTKRFIGAVDAPPYLTLDSWVESLAPSSTTPGDLLLQMDIEGDEYLALLAASPQTLRRFRIIVLELHGLSALGCPWFCRIIEGLAGKLFQDFHIVHSHPNNHEKEFHLGAFAVPDVLELTLLRKDRSPARGHCTRFPHPADAPNLADAPDVVLPSGWRAPGLTAGDASLAPATR